MIKWLIRQNCFNTKIFPIYSSFPVSGCQYLNPCKDQKLSAPSVVLCWVQWWHWKQLNHGCHLHISDPLSKVKLGHSLHGFGMLLSFKVFPVHGSWQNKHRFHTWEFHILCSAEAHFFKRQGEKKRLCCIQIRMFSPQSLSSLLCELGNRREKSGCN